MTQDERNMLADLANKISQTPMPPKDADAEDFIRKNIGARPDALYLMTQTVLIQNMALQQAQHQIQDLQQRAGQPVPGSGGGFLGQNAGQQPSYQQPQGQYSQSQYGPPPPYSGPQVAPQPSGMSGFLRGAAQTAAGVAAGTLAIQGIESLFSHHSGFGGSGLFGGGGIGGYAPSETVIENNYYGDSQGGGEHRGFSDSGDISDASNLGPGDDFTDNTQDDSTYDDSSASGDDSDYTGTGDDGLS